MITGRALLGSALSRVLFVVGVLAVIVGHGVTLDRASVGGLSGGSTVQRVVVMDDAPPDHCDDACAAVLSGTLLLFGWVACRLIGGKRQVAPRRTAIHASSAAGFGGWRVLSPVKLGILRI